MKAMSPENAVLLLEGPEGQLRDRLRREYLHRQSDEEVIYWLGCLLEAFIMRHGERQVGQLQLLIAEIAREKAAAIQARTS